MVYDNGIIFNNYDVLYTVEKSQEKLINDNNFEKKILFFIGTGNFKKVLIQNS